MRYHLPPPDDGPAARAARAVAPVGAPDAALAGHHDEPPQPDGRLMRTLSMPAAVAGAYVRRWSDDRNGAVRHLEIPRATARERSRADRAVPGATRRQRLAVVSDGDRATALHWSAPEPVRPADESAWESALVRLTAGAAAGRGGWTA